MEWALLTRACLVVEPAIAYVRVLNSNRVLPIAVGVGSLISREKPPSNIRYFVVERPFWVNCWKVGLKEPEFKILNGVGVSIEDTIVALEFRDPVALSINGLYGIHVVNKEAKLNCTPLAMIRDTIVLCRSGGSYITTLTGGEAVKRVEYMAILTSSSIPGSSRVEEY